jgi:phosphoribosylaminoimidazole carboxylase PurE protein
MKTNVQPVAIIMGSQSDLPTLKAALDTLKELGIGAHIDVVSAHRTPEKMFEFAKSARKNGFQVIIAAAGGAAHLPGMVAALTTLPVIGVPVATKALDGMDSLLSIVQMPRGVPVATVAIGNSTNAALLAAQILACHPDQKKLQKKLENYRQKERSNVMRSSKALFKRKNRKKAN